MPRRNSNAFGSEQKAKRGKHGMKNRDYSAKSSYRKQQSYGRARGRL